LKKEREHPAGELSVFKLGRRRHDGGVILKKAERIRVLKSGGVTRHSLQTILHNKNRPQPPRPGKCRSRQLCNRQVTLLVEGEKRRNSETAYSVKVGKSTSKRQSSSKKRSGNQSAQVSEKSPARVGFKQGKRDGAGSIQNKTWPRHWKKSA